MDVQGTPLEMENPGRIKNSHFLANKMVTSLHSNSGK